jgi:hypothetical protein
MERIKMKTRGKIQNESYNNISTVSRREHKRRWSEAPTPIAHVTF